METHRIELSHKPLFDDYYARFTLQASDLSFANIFMWRHYYRAVFAEIRGMLTVICRPKGTVPFAFMPTGSCEPERLQAVMADIRDCMRGAGMSGGNVSLKRVEERKLVCLKNAFPESRLSVLYDQDGSDYVYLRDDLVGLRGKKYDGKRNHINKLLSAGDPEYVGFDSATFTEELKAECTELVMRWSQEHHYEEDSKYFCENLANREMLEHFEKLDLKGACLRLDGKVEAFSAGGLLNADMAVIHIEKANHEIRGMYPLINRMFAEKAWEGVKWLNREEDMGLEGLRKAKSSYHPARMVHKYSVNILEGE